MDFIALIFLVLLVSLIVMVFLSPRGRMLCFLLGLVFCWDFVLLGRFEAAELFLLAPLGAMVATVALLVEIPAFAIRTWREWRGP